VVRRQDLRLQERRSTGHFTVLIYSAREVLQHIIHRSQVERVSLCQQSIIPLKTCSRSFLSLWSCQLVVPVSDCRS
jgi:hypothetical protein